MLCNELLRVYYSLQSRIIVTLDPNKFVEKKQQCLDIGNVLYFRPYILFHNQSNPVETRRIYYGVLQRALAVKPSLYTPLPPGTKGFLYYSTPPGKPRIAGELRLRVASSDDPASFECGSDFLKPNGQSWSLPLCDISRFYTHLYEKLREDRLVSDDLDAVLSTFPPIPPGSRPPYLRRHILFTINDTFIVDFSVQMRNFCVVTEKGFKSLPLRREFSEARRTETAPYTGAYTNDHLSIFLN